MSVRTTRRLTVEWGHCDPAGIVFNPRYFEFFDWSTALLVRAALGVDKSDMIATYGIVGIPIVDVRATFLRSCRYGEEIEIRSQVAAVGRSSFEIAHKLFNGAELAVEGHEKRVWTIREPGGRLRSEKLPEEVALRLNGG